MVYRQLTTWSVGYSTHTKITGEYMVHRQETICDRARENETMDMNDTMDNDHRSILNRIAETAIFKRAIYDRDVCLENAITHRAKSIHSFNISD